MGEKRSGKWKRKIVQEIGGVVRETKTKVRTHGVVDETPPPFLVRTKYIFTMMMCPSNQNKREE